MQEINARLWTFEEMRRRTRRDIISAEVRSPHKVEYEPDLCSSHKWTKQGERVCGLLRISEGQRNVILSVEVRSPHGVVTINSYNQTQ